MTEDKINIPYLPYISFNQIQAEELGLNHTEAILMGYFAYLLPNYGEVNNINGENYYWLNYNKIIHDMPTLQFSQSTYKRYINKFIKDGLLLREIKKEEGKLPRAFYRATDKFLTRPKNLVHFELVYNNIEDLLKEGKIYSNDKERLIKLLSSYKGNKIKKETTYNLDGVGGTEIMNYLKEQFILAEKGEGINIDVGTEINKQWIIEQIIQPIKNKGKLNGWLPPGADGKYRFDDLTKRKVLSKLQTMFEWHICHPKTGKKTTIKNMKAKINTFFGTSWI